MLNLPIGTVSATMCTMPLYVRSCGSLTHWCLNAYLSTVGQTDRHACTYAHMLICTWLYTHTYHMLMHKHAYLHTWIHNMYTYIHIHVLTHTHIHIHIHAFTHTYMHLHTHIHTHIHIYVLTHIHIYIYMHLHTFTYTYIYMHLHTHIHTRIVYIERGLFWKRIGPWSGEVSKDCGEWILSRERNV